MIQISINFSHVTLSVSRSSFDEKNQIVFIDTGLDPHVQKMTLEIWEYTMRLWITGPDQHKGSPDRSGVVRL